MDRKKKNKLKMQQKETIKDKDILSTNKKKTFMKKRKFFQLVLSNKIYIQYSKSLFLFCKLSVNHLTLKIFNAYNYLIPNLYLYRYCIVLYAMTMYYIQ